MRAGWVIVVCAAVGCGRAALPALPASGTPETTPPADAERSDSGLVWKVLAPGRGDQRPGAHDKVRVRFSAWDGKGQRSDSSEKRGGPSVFAVDGVIAGWSEALQLMRVGEQRRLWIPDRLVYVGRPGYPRADSIFDIELLEIVQGASPPPAPPDVAAAPSDATKTASGLAYKLLERHEGASHDDTPRAWDRVKLHYTGWTSDGALVASSRSQERPAVFDLPKTIPGWREALQLMAAGDRVRLWIPEALSYQGKLGQPKGTLVYDIELLAIERQPEPPRPPPSLTAAPPDAKKTKSGLAYQLLHRGTSTTKPRASDRVEVHYAAWTSGGELFDSTHARGAPATIPVDHIIRGWSEGLQLMAEGDRARFWIPERLAYAGASGSPKGPLIYDVELLKITR